MELGRFLITEFYDQLALQIQFGSDFGQPRDFKRKFLDHLTDVLQVYPAARLSQ